MPIRQVDTDDKLRIWRSFKVGKLMDMIFLDTRQYDRDITSAPLPRPALPRSCADGRGRDLYYNTDYVASISNDTDRSIMGSKEEGWFYKQLSQSQARNATWRLVMQQVVFSRLDFSPLGEVADFDAWDGPSRLRACRHPEELKASTDRLPREPQEDPRTRRTGQDRQLVDRSRLPPSSHPLTSCSASSCRATRMRHGSTTSSPTTRPATTPVRRRLPSWLLPR